MVQHVLSSMSDSGDMIQQGALTNSIALRLRTIKQEIS